jgi:hypothetical protein
MNRISLRPILLLVALIGGGSLRAAEIEFLKADPLGQSVLDLDPEAPAIFVNQSGYNLGRTKRFTAVNLPEGSRFAVIEDTTGAVQHAGVITGGVGDFTDFEPEGELEFRIKIDDTVSDPFRIGPWWLERVSYQLAMDFMVMSRNRVGNVTEPASHSYAWRDDHHFAFHLRTLVNQYLSNPAAYDRMERTIGEVVDESGLSGTLQSCAVEAPDIVKLIHWAADNTVTQNLTHSYFKGDLAFFLYAWPYYEEWMAEEDYETVKTFALDNWHLRTIDQEYPFDAHGPRDHDLFRETTFAGGEKGAHPAGMNILSNALMAVVLERDGDARAKSFRNAARRQVRWVVNHLDPADPALVKGQRMSADILIASLGIFARVDPAGVPPELNEFITHWAQTVVGRSDNLWDFLRLNDEGQWLVYEDGHPTKWNDPGSVLAMPSALLEGATLVDDEALRERLVEIAVASLDHVFGRNPTGRHFSYDGAREIEGVERGWYSFFDGGVGMLMDVPFAFDGAPKAPHYPYNPQVGDISWVEGWVSFNTAYNRSLTTLAYHDTGISIDREGDTLRVTLEAPLNFDYAHNEPVTVELMLDGNERTRLTLHESAPQSRSYTGVLAYTGTDASVSYGHGYYQHQASLTAE